MRILAEHLRNLDEVAAAAQSLSIGTTAADWDGKSDNAKMIVEESMRERGECIAAWFADGSLPV